MTTKNVFDLFSQKKDFPDFRIGDTIKVHVKIKEGDKERVQLFEGVVIRKHGGKLREASFTVRKISYGTGIERIFPYECSSIEKIEIAKKGRVRRAKLFYLRDLVGKSAKVAELKDVVAEVSSQS